MYSKAAGLEVCARNEIEAFPWLASPNDQLGMGSMISQKAPEFLGGPA